MRYLRARRALIFWMLFIGIGAVGGACAMFYDTSGKWMGMDALLPYFQVLPFAKVLFQNFLFPGIALLIVNGLTNLTAAVLLLKRKKPGILLGMVFGITLMLWIGIQFVIFPANFMSTIYFIFGFLQFATGYACFVFYRQETDDFDPTDYPQVGTNPTTLVVYFSRLSRTARVAYECANQTGADIVRLETSEHTEGTGGFWWCGRFGMHKWDMQLKECDIDLNCYERIIVCTPVWVFSVAAPVRSFLHEAANPASAQVRGQLHHLSCIAVHFNPWLPKHFFEEIEEITGVPCEKRESICCQLGRFKKQ